MKLTRQQLADCMPFAGGRIDTYLEPLNIAMAEAEINTPARAAMWIAQIAHESGEMRWVEEIATGAAYEGRRDLGNIHPGDGVRFKGRGLLQITGRFNYAACSRYLGGFDSLLLDNPELLATVPLFAARSAAWFWRMRGLNVQSDRHDMIGATRKINGGRNGLADRIRYYDRARIVLGDDMTARDD